MSTLTVIYSRSRNLGSVLIQLATAMGLTEQDLDQLFITAAGL